MAGTLIGLLFVAISLRYDAIFGTVARNRATAAAAFTALADALALSLWALVPHVNLGYPSAVISISCLSATIRTHVSRDGRRDTSARLFALALLVYSYQFVNAVVLIARPHDSVFVFSVAYTVYATFSTGLGRSWQLLQPETPSSTPSAGVDPAPSS